MATPKENQEIVGWLKQRGHSPEEIEKILEKLTAYDQAVVRDALFDSMNSGSFDIEEVIRQALREEQSP
jgi:hypothetical protein